MKILLFADLDDTLFTSARKAPPGATHLPAAYLRDGSPISYASPAQQTLLAFPSHSMPSSTTAASF